MQQDVEWTLRLLCELPSSLIAQNSWTQPFSHCEPETRPESFRQTRDLPARSMPPVVVGVVEALAEGQGVADELLRLTLVGHLLLFGFALELRRNITPRSKRCTGAVKPQRGQKGWSPTCWMYSVVMVMMWLM